jgi:hypothetical protein
MDEFERQKSKELGLEAITKAIAEQIGDAEAAVGKQVTRESSGNNSERIPSND